MNITILPELKLHRLNKCILLILKYFKIWNPWLTFKKISKMKGIVFERYFFLRDSEQWQNVEDSTDAVLRLKKKNF